MHNFYATDPKNIVNFEIGNKSTTCGPAATKTSKVTDTLIYMVNGFWIQAKNQAVSEFKHENHEN